MPSSGTSSANLQRPNYHSLQVKDVIFEKDREGGDASGLGSIAEKDENGNPIEKTDTPIPQLVQQVRPVRRMINPYDEYLKEQERILQARKEAKEKYTKISAT